MAAYILKKLHALECVEKYGKTQHEYYALPWGSTCGRTMLPPNKENMVLLIQSPQFTK